MQHAASLTDDPTRVEIRRRIAATSVAKVASELGLSRHAVLTLATPGANPRAGTVAIARERLAAKAA